MRSMSEDKRTKMKVERRRGDGIGMPVGHQAVGRLVCIIPPLSHLHSVLSTSPSRDAARELGQAKRSTHEVIAA